MNQTWRMWLVGTVVLTTAAVCFGAGMQNQKQLSSTSVFTLRNISADQGKAILAELKLGTTVSKIPQNNALVITAPPRELLAARNVLGIVDSKKQYIIKKLPVTLAPEVARTKQISDASGDLSIGTMLDPPASNKANAIIFDLTSGTPVLIAPADSIERAEAVITGTAAAPLQETQSAAEVETEVTKPNTAPPAVAKKAAPIAPPVPAAAPQANANINNIIDANTAEPNEFFNKVVGDLLEQKKQEEAEAAEASKKAAEEMAQAEAAAKETVEPSLDQDTAAPVAAGHETQGVVSAPEPNVTRLRIDPNGFRPDSIPNGDQIIELSLPETVQIVSLLDLLGRYLNVDYMYDPAKVTGTVTLKLRPGPLKVRELYALTESALKFSGFVMSRRGNLITVVPATEAANVDPALKMDSLSIQPGDVIVTSVFHLNYISVDSAIVLLTNMKLGITPQGTSNIIPMHDSSSIIVTEYGYRMDRIEKLLRLVDVPGAPRQFRFRQLKYTLASALVPKIQGLAQQLGPDTLRIETGAAAPAAGASRYRSNVNRPAPQPGQPQPAGAAGATSKAGVYLDFDERTNRVLMVGAAADTSLIDQLIDTFDVPQQDLRTIQEYQVQFVDARQIVDTLATLGIVAASTTGGGGYSSYAGRQPGMAGGQAQPNIAQQGQAGMENPQEQPQIAILESTNALLVNATPEQHAAIQMIIAHVDREPAELAIPYTIYPLEYQDPAELQKVLSELIEKTIRDKEGKATTTPRRDEDITIVADEKAFSLIVYASRKNQDWIGTLIRQLDRKRPQVLIETTLVEITRDDKFNYDLSLYGSNPQSVATTANTPIKPLNSSVIGNRTVKQVSTSGSGGLTGFYSDDNIQALLTAIETKSYGRVLAKPKVLVNDNEKGSIKTQDTRYIANTTTQVPTTGSAISSTTFQAYDAKLELEITPHISEGDLLLLEVKLTREDFVGQGTTVTDGQGGEVTSPPNKVASNVDTIVTVPDGSTIILGGLIKLNQLKSGGKVPILGDIPLVGLLFRNIDNTDTESKLYVFVKAYVLRPAEKTRGLPQLEQISRENTQAFEHDEKKFQGQQDIPGLNPAPLDPVKVLEEQ